MAEFVCLVCFTYLVHVCGWVCLCGHKIIRWWSWWHTAWWPRSKHAAFRQRGARSVSWLLESGVIHISVLDLWLFFCNLWSNYIVRQNEFEPHMDSVCTRLAVTCSVCDLHISVGPGQPYVSVCLTWQCSYFITYWEVMQVSLTAKAYLRSVWFASTCEAYRGLVPYCHRPMQFYWHLFRSHFYKNIGSAQPMALLGGPSWFGLGCN